MRKLILALMTAGILASAAQCGAPPPKCPVGYYADKDVHGNWGCYPARS